MLNLVSMTSIGQTLADERRRRKASIKDVEKAIKIRAKYITAIEKDAFNEIDGEAYVVGFLKTYAEWLDINPEPLLKTYRAQAGIAQRRHDGRISDADTVKIRRRQIVLALVLLVGAIILIIWLASFFSPLG